MDKKFPHHKLNIFLFSSVLIVFAVLLVVRSGRLARTPKVTTTADNCYTETLTVLTDEDYNPYSFYDEKGKFSGHDVELINLVANEMHMNLDLKFMKWDEAIKEITLGNADVLMTCDYSDSFEGVDKLIKCEPVSSDDFIIYSKKRINSSDALYGNRIGIMKNGNVMTEIKKRNLYKYCIGYPDNRMAMKALINDEVDFVVMRQTVGTVLLRELKASGIKGKVLLSQSDMCFGINCDNPELADKINDALEALKIKGELEKLRKKWLTTFVRPYSFIEILGNNLWIGFSFVLLLVITILLLVRGMLQKRIADEEKFRNAKVVEWLTQDFVCVNYIGLTENPQNDRVINYRVSENLKTRIPGWEKERYFSNKLDLLRDNLVYEQDRKQFDDDVLREKVIKSLKESGVYFVNTRLFVDNEIRYFQMKFSPVYEENILKGMVVGLHSVDVQTKKEMALQEQLQDALSKAEVANKAKTDFLFNMSHDIRTPLNAITGFTNMAVKYIDNKEKVLNCLEKTQKSGSLLLSLINSVLDISRIESDKIVLEEQDGDVYYSFASIESTMQDMAASKNIKLSFEFGNIKDKFVLCDFNRCARVFLNIISNAIKYAKEDGYVKVFCEQLDEAPAGYGVYRYTFEDNGIGMSEEFQKHVFEKFSRENNVTVSGIQGTGLGMAVCKSFVELMNGTIDCKSELGKGTVFTVTLPFKLQEGKKYTEPSTGRILEEGSPSQETLSFKGKTILLTDDNELNLEIAVDILEEQGFIVETASDGTEAVELLKEKGPDYYDFILMDIQMPVMGGYEATKEIRRMYPDSQIPIIALSANAFAEDKAASLSAGMNGHVAKPIEINALFNTLQAFI